MKYSLALKGIDLSDVDRNLMEQKLNRLKKRVKPPFRADIVLSHDKRHRTGNVVNCTINFHYMGTIAHVKRTANTAQDAIDESIGALKNEIMKKKDKNTRKKWKIGWPFSRGK
jgi:ribosomal subunit interface protein